VRGLSFLDTLERVKWLALFGVLKWRRCKLLSKKCWHWLMWWKFELHKFSGWRKDNFSNLDFLFLPCLLTKRVDHRSCWNRNLSKWCKNFDFWIVDLCRCVAWCWEGCPVWEAIENITLFLRRIFWAFHYCLVFSIIWVLQDCWDEVRKFKLMLCIITIKNQRTVCKQLLLAFLFPALVSAKDEYEQ